MAYTDEDIAMMNQIRQAQQVGGEADMAARNEWEAQQRAIQQAAQVRKQALMEEEALQNRAMRDQQIGDQAHAVGLEEGVNKGRKAEVDYRNGLVTNKARDIAATVGQQPQGQQVSAPVANSREMYAKAQQANIA